MKRRFSQKESIEKDNLKTISPFFDIYNEEYDFNETGIKKQFLPLAAISDSIYLSQETNLFAETEDEIQMNNKVYLDSSQKEKVLKLLDNPELDYDLSRFLETIQSIRQENDFTIEKKSNWVVHKKSLVESGNTKIIIEYFFK